MRWAVAAVMLLGGCMTPTAQRTDLANVSVGSSGSIHGGQTMTIFADDSAVHEGHRGTPDSVWRETEQLPDGVYARTRAVALTQVAQLDLSDNADICQDYGTDFIRVYDAPGQVYEARTTCPNPAMKAAQIAVNNPRDLATGALVE